MERKGMREMRLPRVSDNCLKVGGGELGKDKNSQSSQSIFRAYLLAQHGILQKFPDRKHQITHRIPGIGPKEDYNITYPVCR